MEASDPAAQANSSQDAAPESETSAAKPAGAETQRVHRGPIIMSMAVPPELLQRLMPLPHPTMVRFRPRMRTAGAGKEWSPQHGRDIFVQWRACCPGAKQAGQHSSPLRMQSPHAVAQLHALACAAGLPLCPAPNASCPPSAKRLSVALQNLELLRYVSSTFSNCTCRWQKWTSASCVPGCYRQLLADPRR